jgi:glycosyltransferase involved in cell wall biosynthesis
MTIFDPYPLVSIIMPVRNEALYIMQSIDAVLCQDYPREYLQIIVVDGQSDDNTLELIQKMPEAARICIVSNKRKIQSAGLNQAIHMAVGEIIMRVDGHTVIAPDYVRCCVETLCTTHADNVGGSIRPVGNTAMGRAIAFASRSRFAIPTTFRFSSKAQYTDTVYMGAWPRRVFEQVGMFNEQFIVNEDYEFNFRIRRAGGLIYFSPDICSEYYGKATLRALAKQHFRYGASKPKTLMKHPKSLHIRHLAAPAFVAFVFGGGLLSILIPQVASYWVSGLGLYFLVNILFSVRAGQQGEPSLLLRIPWVFVAIHTAWGVGFWFATIQMLLRLVGGRKKLTSLS